MQLSFDAADRLVELVEARHGPGAGRGRGARRSTRCGMSRPGSRARCSPTSSTATRGSRWRGANVGLADPPGDGAPARGRDLRRRRSRDDRALARHLVDLRDRRRARARRSSSRSGSRRSSTRAGRCPLAIAALTGIDPRELRGAPPVELAVRRFLEFAGDAVLVAHNARFDIGFLDREVERLTGRRIAAPVVDTVWLARRVLAGRVTARRARVARALLRHRRRGRATGRSPTRRRRPRSCSR